MSSYKYYKITLNNELDYQELSFNSLEEARPIADKLNYFFKKQGLLIDTILEEIEVIDDGIELKEINNELYY